MADDEHGLGPKGKTSGSFGGAANDDAPSRRGIAPNGRLRVACDLTSLMPGGATHRGLAHGLARLAAAGHAVSIVSASAATMSPADLTGIERRIEMVASTFPNQTNAELRSAGVDPVRVLSTLVSRVDIEPLPDKVITRDPTLWRPEAPIVHCGDPGFVETLQLWQTSKLQYLIDAPFPNDRSSLGLGSRRIPGRDI